MSLKIRPVILCGALLAGPVVALAQEPAPPPEAPKPTEPAPQAPATPAPEAKKHAKTAWPIGDPPLHRWGGLTIAVSGWTPGIANSEDDIALQQGLRDIGPVSISPDEHIKEQVKVLYHLPKDKGAVRFVYDSMNFKDRRELFNPGNFVYGETLTYPFLAGVEDDGLADGIRANSLTKTREFRIEYENTAFESPHAKGRFHVGLRYMDHARSLEANYYALVPTFPPFLPPTFPDNFNPLPFFPVPDQARTQSDFSASGVGAGLELEFPVHARVSIVGGFSIGVFSGRLDTRYTSTTWGYFDFSGTTPLLLTFDEVLARLESGDKTQYGSVAQAPVSVNLRTADAKRLAYNLDVYVGIEGKIWRSLKGSLGIRQLAYLDAGADNRLAPPVLQPLGQIDVLRATRRDLSVEYGSYYAQLSYRF